MSGYPWDRGYKPKPLDPRWYTPEQCKAVDVQLADPACSMSELMERTGCDRRLWTTPPEALAWLYSSDLEQDDLDDLEDSLRFLDEVDHHDDDVRV